MCASQCSVCIVVALHSPHFFHRQCICICPSLAFPILVLRPALHARAPFNHLKRFAMQFANFECCSRHFFHASLFGIFHCACIPHSTCNFIWHVITKINKAFVQSIAFRILVQNVCFVTMTSFYQRGWWPYIFQPHGGGRNGLTRNSSGAVAADSWCAEVKRRADGEVSMFVELLA